MVGAGENATRLQKGKRLVFSKEKYYICKGVYCNRLRHRPAPTGIVGTIVIDSAIGPPRLG